MKKIKLNFLYRVIPFVVFVLLTNLCFSQQVITQWNFNPYNSAFPASTGTGTLNVIGGCTSAASTNSVASGSSDPVDPATNNDAIKLNNFPAQSTNSGTAGIELAVSSAGFENIKFSFDTKPGQATSKYLQVQYSVNGTDWINSTIFTMNATATWENNLMVDFSSIPEVNNNANFKVRIVSIFEPGKTTYTGASKPYDAPKPVHFDMITVLGTPRSAVATKLSITSINGGAPVVMGQTFSVSIQALDDDDSPAAVQNNTEVTLSLATGTGSLGGTLTGTINAGTLSVNIPGITYNKAEAGVSFTASATGLSAFTSESFEVVVPTYQLTLTQNIPGAGLQTGSGLYAEGASVTVTASPKSGFVFVNWTLLNDTEVSTSASSTFTMPASAITLKANYQLLSGPNLIHYWHFNNATELSVPLTSVDADFSSVETATITFVADGIMGVYSNSTLNPADLNAYMSAPAGNNLRLANPSTGKEVILSCPSSGYEGLYFTFAASGVGSGSAKKINLYYTVDNTNWVKVIDAYELVTSYQLFSCDLTSFNDVNNNADLKFKITFDEAGIDGNQRLDNISLTGTEMVSSIIESNVQNEKIRIYPNPFTDIVNVNYKAGTKVSVYSQTGSLIERFNMHAETYSIDLKKYHAGVYFISIEDGENVIFSKVIKN
jgi:hypothetical protein